MKEKLNAKERREQAEKAKRAIIEKIENDRKIAKDKEKNEKDEKNRLAEEAKILSIAKERVANEPGKGEINKSSAKAAGVKSTFVIKGDELLITSFGRGNQALREKSVTGETVTSLRTPEAFGATAEGNRFRIEAKRFLTEDRQSITVDNPLINDTHHPGDDLIHCREALERRFFGITFKDNIHIQAAYSILDIEKILTVHINNIVYALNNMLRNNGPEYSDLIGYLGLDGKYATYESFCGDKRDERLYSRFKALCEQKQLGYFGIEIIDPKKSAAEKGKAEKKADKEKPDKHEPVCVTEEQFFYMLCLLGQLRQALAHGDNEKAKYLYDLSSCKSPAAEKARQVLDMLYEKRVGMLNHRFIDMSKNDLILLFRAFSVTKPEDKRRYTKDYYDFVVRKSYKNLGFSVKTLREEIVSGIEEAAIVKDDRYSTVRQKLYRLFDFALFSYYRGDAKAAEELIDSLRASANALEKARIYVKEARRVWPLVQDQVLNHILPNVTADQINELIKDKVQPGVTQDMIADSLIGNKADYFCEYIYLLTLFLDGKEINDLLTTLINKFENIDSFNSVMAEAGLKTGYIGIFNVFSRSAAVSGELRAINSFARMSTESGDAKEIMFIEAARLLGYPESDEKLKEYIKEILSKEKGPRRFDGNKDFSFRNFIANNVIESTRFRYLVRYGNTEQLSKLAKNTAVVRFVLNGIPDDQIRRYYLSCNGINYSNAGMDEMRDDLCSRIARVSFTDFSGVKQRPVEGSTEGEEKQRYVAIIRLYLAVLYLLVKNLVYVNSRYFLAFHCVERDAVLMGVKLKDENDDRVYAEAAKVYLQLYPGKKRVNKYLHDNFENSDPWAVTAYRNTVEHLGAVRNAHLYIGDAKSFSSYFELYHYLVQRSLISQFEHDKQILSRREGPGYGKPIISEEKINPVMLKYFALVQRYGCYCKDMVKALNVPFAYNLPRYKNLSIDGLFDRNDTREKPKGKEISVAPEME